MTVSSQTNKVIYVGNGVAKEYALPFPFLDQNDIRVRQKLGEIQTERTDWTVENGNLVFAAAPENGAEIAVVREVPLTQETDYRDNEILHAETLERCFDKLTMQIQQLNERIDRAVTVDVFDDTQAASLIPAIRQAVSDCQTAVAATAANAQTAAERASAASTSAVDAAASETNAAAMLGTKANADLNNLTANGKENLAEMLMPDYSRTVVLTAGVAYTASCAGVFCGYYRGTAGTGTTYTVNGFTQTYAAGFDDNLRPSGASFFVLVSKGESYSAARANNLYFIPLKGVAA